MSFELLNFYEENIVADFFLRSSLAFEAAIGGYTSATFGELISRRRRKADGGACGASAPIELTLAQTPAELSLADGLIAAQYALRGYQIRESSADAPACPSARSPRRASVILARLRGEAVGTVTVGIDGPTGLLVDQANREFVAPFRQRGHRLGEVVRLAVTTQAESRRILAALFNAAHGVMTVNRLHDVFIEVNPRHVGFYSRALCFEAAGEEKLCPRVGAPSMLLKMKVEDLTRKIGSLESAAEGFPLVD